MYKEAQQPQESNFFKILFCILSAPRVSGADGSERGTSIQAPQPSVGTQYTHTTAKGSSAVREGTTKGDFFELNNLQHFTIEDRTKTSFPWSHLQSQGPAHCPYLLSHTYPNSDLAVFICTKQQHHMTRELTFTNMNLHWEERKNSQTWKQTICMHSLG